MGQEAKGVINKIIRDVLADHEVRKNLDSEYHILDLSFASISTANTREMRTSRTIGWGSYQKFIRAVRADASSRGCFVPTMEIALEKIATNKGACLVGLFLVCRNFDQARDTISRISGTPGLIDDPSFGQTYRERTLAELQTQYQIPANMSKNLGILKDKAFIQASGKIGQVAAVPDIKDPTKTVTIWFEDPSLGTFSEVAYYASRQDELDDVVSIDNLNPNFTGSQVTAKPPAKDENLIPIVGPREIALYERDGKKYPFVKRNRLSVLDLGHAYMQWDSTGRTPLGEKLAHVAAEGILIGDPRVSATVRAVIDKYQKDLADKHSAVKWTFHNTVPRKGWGETSALNIIKYSGGYVVLTIQHYKQNNALAVHEGRIRREVEEELLNIIRFVPGSNTITQDIVEDVTNLVLGKIGGKPRKLKPHVPISDKVDVDPIVPKASTSKVSGPKKTKKSGSNPKPSPIRLRTNSGRFTSLISLQNLLNQNLHSQIQKNMGTGERTDILNYRTGRLARSASVENMSQSRQGMITAFYSYMRNPYGTFSIGGAQASPASRDPKLLISKSIREIGATMVGNRMRAVLV